MQAPAHRRRTILYSGRVQGVGFRATAVQAARGLPITGYVRNLDDGRVELVAEGDPDALDTLEQRIHGALGRNIHGTEKTASAATGEFSGFRIRP